VDGLRVKVQLTVLNVLLATILWEEFVCSAVKHVLSVAVQAVKLAPRSIISTI